VTDESALLDIQTEDGNGPHVVRVRGELDLTNAAALEDALDGVTGRTVILDLTGVVFVDSAGIRTIDAAYKRHRKSNRTLLIVAPPGSRAGWTFRVAGFTSDFVLDSLDTARALAGGDV
jgi:anti-sigma B factor antagonist